MIKVGLVGAGGMGNVHSRQYAKMPDVQVRFIDRSPDRRAQFAEMHSFDSFDTFEQLLDWADVIDICLPTDLHLEVTKQALAANKNVFLEKPICRTTEECAELLEDEEASKGWVMPLQVVRYFPEFRSAHDVVASGRLGRIGTVRTRRGGLCPTGSDSWFRDFDRSGGVLLDACIHDFDWMRWSFGEVKRVQSRAHGFSSRRDAIPGDYSLTILEFDSGAIGHVEGTWMDPMGFRTTIDICGSEGVLQHDSRTTRSLQMYKQDKSIIGESGMLPHDDPYYRQLRSAVDATANGTPPPISLYEGAMAVSISIAAIESSISAAFAVPTRY